MHKHIEDPLRLFSLRLYFFLFFFFFLGGGGGGGGPQREREREIGGERRDLAPCINLSVSSPEIFADLTASNLL